MRPGRETVTLIRRVVASTDPYGNDTTTETSATVDGCSVQPADSTEVLASADRITTRMRLYAPAGTDLTAVDAVEHNGTRYEVDGEPMVWASLTGTGHHVEAYLRKWTG
jgi:hypothetical protein